MNAFDRTISVLVTLAVDNETESGRVCIDSAYVGTVRCWQSVALTTVLGNGAREFAVRETETVAS